MGNVNISKHGVFFGRDTDEAIVMRRVLEMKEVEVCDRNLGPDASASSYKDRILEVIERGGTVVLAGLQNDLPDDSVFLPKARIKECDPAVSLKELTLGEKKALVPEVEEEPSLEFVVNKVIEATRDQVRKAIEERKEFPDADNFTVVKLPHNGASMFLRQWSDDRRNLLVVSANGNLDYFGDKALCELLQKKFGGFARENHWSGNPNECVEPFIYGYLSKKPNLVAEEFLRTAERLERNSLIDDKDKIDENPVGKKGQFVFETDVGRGFLGGVKGELLSTRGEKCRFKLALVDRKYSGEDLMPKVGETWMCEVVSQTLPDPSKGKVFLRPIERAEKQWLFNQEGVSICGLKRLQPVCYFGMHCLQDHDDKVPLNMQKFSAQADGAYEGMLRQCGLHADSAVKKNDPDRGFDLFLKKGLDIEVVEWKLAVSKLGQPSSVKPAPEMHGFKVQWGERAIALVSAETLIKADIPYTYDASSVDNPWLKNFVDMQVNVQGFGEVRIVVGVCSTAIYPAYYLEFKNIGEPARVSDICPEDVKGQVIKLLSRLTARPVIDIDMEDGVNCLLKSKMNPFYKVVQQLEKCLSRWGSLRSVVSIERRDITHESSGIRNKFVDFKLNFGEEKAEAMSFDVSDDIFFDARLFDDNMPKNKMAKFKFFLEIAIKTIRETVEYADKFLELVDKFKEDAKAEASKVFYNREMLDYHKKEMRHREKIAEIRAFAGEVLWKAQELFEALE